MDRLRIVLCSTSAGAHTLAAVLSAQPDVDVSVFTLNAAKATQWQGILEHERLVVTAPAPSGDGTHVASTAGPFRVTSAPEAAAEGCDLVILVVPAFLHARYLTALAPHLPEGCVIVGLPGHCGFEFEVRHLLRTHVCHFTVVNFDALPWIVRTPVLGRRVHIAATKDVLVGAAHIDPDGSRIPDLAATLQRLLGRPPQLVLAGHPVGITLRAPNASVHPAVMYSRWKDWEGEPLSEAPRFYREIDELAASLIAGVSEECMAIAAAIMRARPEADLSRVVSAYDWEVAAYGPLIADRTNLMTALRTNAGHDAARHPMTELAPRRLAPDFGHRFLSEDIPYGLVVVRGIAEIAGVETPTIDRVLTWGQERLGREYLTPAGCTGRDIPSSRAPQRYGLTTLDEVLGYERSRLPALSV